MDQAIFDWFLNMRSQNVPLPGSMIHEKAVIFAKELNTENFQASGGWLRCWKKEIIYNSRLFPGSRNLSHQRWLMRDRKRPFQLFRQTMT